MTFSDGSNYRACNALAYEHLVHHADALKSPAIKMSVGNTAQRGSSTSSKLCTNGQIMLAVFSGSEGDKQAIELCHCLIH